jgi:competence protein ComEC
VLRISNGVRTALLAGDLEAPQEARLVEQHAPLRADLLLVPHHGSKTSSSADFLDAVHPSLALVQAGYRNRFGHPAPPVMDRYRDRAITVVDSPHCGAALWSSREPDRVMGERDESRRYWMHRVP